MVSVIEIIAVEHACSGPVPVEMVSVEELLTIIGYACSVPEPVEEILGVVHA